MSELTDNPKPNYSSYLTQQQIVSDVQRLDRLVEALEKQIDTLRIRVSALEQSSGVTTFPARPAE